MNHDRYRLVFSRCRRMLVPVFEGVRTVGRDRSGRVRRRAGALIAVLLAVPVAFAASPLPPGTLPVPMIPMGPDANIAAIGNAIASINDRTLTVEQSTQRAVIDWHSFNIAADAAVRFNQPGATAAVLNRIHSLDPSIIQGRLSANGDVYLINQNGILFDRGSQINTGGLTASTLNIAVDLFQKGLLSNQNPASIPAFDVFTNGLASGAVIVESGASIRTASGGRVLLAGPEVRNAGTIEAPDGQVILAAGQKIYLAASQDPQLRGLLVEVDQGGTARNLPGGTLSSARGNVTMVGFALNQEGRVSATSTVSVNGSIRLVARDTVSATEVQGVRLPQATRYGTLTLGEGSVTEVHPERDSAAVAPDSQALNPGRIELGGAQVNLLRNSLVHAPSGSITISAQRGATFAAIGGQPAPGVRVYLEEGSRLDVAGLAGVSAPMDRNLLEVELRGNELRDAPLVRNSPVRGKTVYVDLREGTPLADISGYTGQVRRTVAERSTVGGTIRVQSEGDIVFRNGASMDVSGGSIDYAAGYLRTSKLVTIDGRVVDIGSADPNQFYAGLVDEFQSFNSKWGVPRAFRTADRLSPGYTEGKNAGAINIIAPGAVLDGTFSGRAVQGPYQTTPGTVPLGGKLELGDASVFGAVGVVDFKFASTVIDAAKPTLGAGFGLADELPLQFRDVVFLDPTLIRNGGFNRIAVYSNGTVELKADNDLQLTAGSTGSASVRQTASLILAGRKVDVASDISVAAGSITLSSRQTVPQSFDPESYGVVVAPGVHLSARGLWTNQTAAALAGRMSPPALADAGSVTILSAGNVILGSGSAIDVVAGGTVRSDGSLAGGEGGDVTIRSGRAGFAEGIAQPSRVELGGSIVGFGFSGGGRFELETSLVSIGARSTADTRELVLGPAFVSSGGFSTYAVDGYDGLRVTGGTVIAPSMPVLVASGTYRLRASGTDVLSFSQVALRPLTDRTPTDLELSAGSNSLGRLVVDPGTVIVTDPGATVSLEAGRQLTFAGRIDAPGGRVRLALEDALPSDTFLPDQSLWLARGSSISARGVFTPDVNPTGALTGLLRSGGAVELHAGRGYLIAESTAAIDVSGTTALVDVSVLRGVRTILERQSLASAAGSVSLSAQEGILFDASIAAHGGNASAGGGQLSFELLPPITGNPSFPNGPRRVILEDSARAVPPGLDPGEVIDPNALNSATSTLNHRAFLRTGLVTVSGADSLALKSPDYIEFRGDIDLSLRSTFTADARAFTATDGSGAIIRTGYASLASTSGQAIPSAAAGTAILTIAADLVDLEGPVVMQGFDRITLTAAGDMRLKGFFNPFTRQPALPGSFTTAGDLDLGAARIYPTTFSDFTIQSTGTDTVVRLLRTGAGVGPVLSAAGRLTIKAPTIESYTDVLAPFGEINLLAGEQLVLGAGSLTSVSGAGLLVPFGRTQLGGRDWVYVLAPDTLGVITAPRAKQINLGGPAIDVRSGATVDVSGGGDMLAYEFTAGPGGSLDVLDPVNASGSFAIVPALGLQYAPYDHQEMLSGADTGIAVGQRIEIRNSGAFPDGTYVILPARYALLPGGYLVTPTASGRVTAGAASVQADGSIVVSGRVGSAVAGGGTVFDGMESLFRLQSGSIVRTRSEFTESSANAFFAAATGARPMDAGGLSISPTQALLLDGTINSAAGRGGNGGFVDISAARIAIDDGGAVNDGFVHLDASVLNRLQGQRLLIGGRREVRNGTTYLVPLAEVVEVRDTGENGLRGADLLFAATGELTFGADAVITATGDAGATLGDIRIAADSSGRAAAGAVARFSAAGLSGLVREGAQTTGAGGIVTVTSGASLSGRSILLDAGGDTHVGSGAVLQAREYGLAASRVSLGEVTGSPGGLVLSGTLLTQLQGAERLLLRSYSSIDFHGTLSLGVSQRGAAPTLQRLDLEAGALRGIGTALDAVALGASKVTFSNPSNAAVPALVGGAVALNITATSIDIGSGSKAMVGFSGVELKADQALAFLGDGSLAAAAPVTVGASWITVATGATQSLEAGGGALTVQQVASGVTAPAVEAAAGSLTLAGSSVAFGGRIEARGGRVALEARGATTDADVRVDAGARIAAGGFTRDFAGVYVAAPGGQIALRSAAGSVIVATGASLDVAASDAQGDAGSIRITAPLGTVDVAGTLLGSAAADRTSGTFSVDAAGIADFQSLNGLLEAGGFHEARDYRVRHGDLTVAANDVVTAQRISIGVDDGSLVIQGRLDASGAKGGTIAVFVRGDVLVESAARMDASAARLGTNGGDITIGSESGHVTLTDGAVLKTSAGAGGLAGTVTLRVSRTDDGSDVKLDPFLPSAVVDAREIDIEAVRVYDGIGAIGATGGAGRLSFAQVDSDNAAFLANAGAVRGRLVGSAGDARVHVRPGVEVRSHGDLVLESDWNLYSDQRPGGEPGYLTLRAAGNLELRGSLSDGFTTVPADPTYAGLPTDWELRAGPSWSYRLTAGADLDAVAPGVTGDVAALESAGRGDLIVRGYVRTGTGFIDLAAGRDFSLATEGARVYTAGVPDATATGAADQFFYEAEFEAQAAELGLDPNVFENPVYLTRGGDISVRAGRDAIGRRNTQLVTDWLYKRAFGVPLFGAEFAYVNPQTAWWPRIRVFDQGIGALGGGEVVVSSGRDIVDLSASVATSGRLEGAANEPPDPAKLVVTGGGDLTVNAGRDIVRGVYYVSRGDGTIVAGRDLAPSANGTNAQIAMVLAMDDARISATAGRALSLETAMNPTLLTQTIMQFWNPRPLDQVARFTTYSPQAAVTLTALTGKVQLRNGTGNGLGQSAPQLFGANGQENTDGLMLYPGTLRVVALESDVETLGTLRMSPAAMGNLELLAGESVRLGGEVTMLDNSPILVPGVTTVTDVFTEASLLGIGRLDAGFVIHSDPPLHGADTTPARVVALTGSITATAAPLTIPKPARLHAGLDIRDVNYYGQNLRADDLTQFIAGRTVTYSTQRLPSGVPLANTNAIRLGGPGTLEVIAGDDVDLAASSGLITRGNLDNPFLPEGGARIVVGAGFPVMTGGVTLPDFRTLVVESRVDAFVRALTEPDPAERQRLVAARRTTLQSEFDALAPERRAEIARQVFFEELRASGREASATRDYSRGYLAVERLFPQMDAAGQALAYGGDINLFFSQIKTEAGGDIEMFAPGGVINAGLANTGQFRKDAAQLGVITIDGGSIRAYSRGDFLVNASRVFTLGGGDILIWSSEGNIDAGKGAKTAAATPPPQLKVDRDGKFTLDITQSIQGSGIGVLLAKEGVVPGDVDLIAPRGEVNAGDAGIRVAGNLNIAALRVVGADNIRVGGVSVGVPVAQTSSLAAGLTGVSNVASDATKAAEKVMQQTSDDVGKKATSTAPSFLTVEVIGLGDDEEERRRKR